jgi:hypothetical protein
MRDQQITTAMPEPSSNNNGKEAQSFNATLVTVSMRHSATFIKFSINTGIHKFSKTLGAISQNLGAKKGEMKKVNGPKTLSTTTQNLVVQSTSNLPTGIYVLLNKCTLQNGTEHGIVIV